MVRGLRYPVQTLLDRRLGLTPNECWRTHPDLERDGTGVEIINWLDDHSRYLLATRAYRRITGQIVTATFLAAADRCRPATIHPH